MSRGRARDRLSRGIQNETPGQAHPRGGIEHSRVPVGNVSNIRFAARRLAGIDPDERDTVREYLKENGSPKAIAILTQLERTWAIRDQQGKRS